MIRHPLGIRLKDFCEKSASFLRAFRKSMENPCWLKWRSARGARSFRRSCPFRKKGLEDYIQTTALIPTTGREYGTNPNTRRSHLSRAVALRRLKPEQLASLDGSPG